MEDERYVIVSSIESLNSFFKSLIWQDIVGLLKDGRRDGQSVINTHGLSLVDTEFARGRLEQIQQILFFPETMIEYKGTQEELMKLSQQTTKEDSDVTES